MDPSGPSAGRSSACWPCSPSSSVTWPWSAPATTWPPRRAHGERMGRRTYGHRAGRGPRGRGRRVPGGRELQRRRPRLNTAGTVDSPGPVLDPTAVRAAGGSARRPAWHRAILARAPAPRRPSGSTDCSGASVGRTLTGPRAMRGGTSGITATGPTSDPHARPQERVASPCVLDVRPGARLTASWTASPPRRATRFPPCSRGRPSGPPSPPSVNGSCSCSPRARSPRPTSTGSWSRWTRRPDALADTEIVVDLPPSIGTGRRPMSTGWCGA